MDFLKMLLETKTGRTAIGGLLLAIGGFMQGQLNTAELIAAIFVVLQTINLRDGVRKLNGK